MNNYLNNHSNEYIKNKLMFRLLSKYKFGVFDFLKSDKPKR